MQTEGAWRRRFVRPPSRGGPGVCAAVAVDGGAFAGRIPLDDEGGAGSTGRGAWEADWGGRG